MKTISRELSAPGVTGNDLNDLRALVGEFRDVLALTNDELGCTNVVKHRIETGESPPTKFPPRGERDYQGRIGCNVGSRDHTTLSKYLQFPSSTCEQENRELTSWHWLQKAK